MNWFFALPLGVLLFFLLKKYLLPQYQQRAKKKRDLKLLQGKQVDSRARRVVAFLHRDIDLQCLKEDGKVYGYAFENTEPPKLPHNATCRCVYQPVYTSLANLFRSTPSDKIYPSDLGDLLFKEYKFYKYSLMMQHSKDSPEEYQILLELKDNLQIDAAFQARVSQQLSSVNS